MKLKNPPLEWWLYMIVGCVVFSVLLAIASIPHRVHLLKVHVIQPVEPIFVPIPKAPERQDRTT